MIKKILVLAHDSSLYGASKSLLTLLEFIVQKKIANVFVVLPYKGPMEQYLENLKIDFKVIEYPIAVYNKNSYSFFGKLKQIVKFRRKENKALSDLIELSKRIKPEYIYTNTSVITTGYKLSKILDIRHIWHIREYGDLDYNFNYLPNKLSIILKLYFSFRVIFVSKDLQKHWKSYPIKNSKVIYNGIYSLEYEPMLKKIEIGGEIKISILGAITSGKGQDIAIKAIELLIYKFPTIKLYIYGDNINDAYFKELIDYIKGRNLINHVCFSSFVSNVEKEVYENSQLILSCSKSEAFGRTIVEAMGNGIPIIANSIGGPKEIITNGFDGMLYDGSPDDLATKIDILLSDSKMYKEISFNAIKSSKEKYSKEIYCRNICEYLNLM